MCVLLTHVLGCELIILQSLDETARGGGGWGSTGGHGLL